MWTYVIRRIVAMIPTLFGVTVVSFCIMQLAPGDPLMIQAGSAGGAGESTQTREAFLVQKRDLKLDKPLVINLNYYRDFASPMKSAAYFEARSIDQVREDVAVLAKATDPESAARLGFLRSLKIPDFDSSLTNPEKYGALARKIQTWVQIFCEDTGAHGVPATLALLEAPDGDLHQKIGAIRCLSRMVVAPFVFTYSSHPSEAETPKVVSAWKEWWRKNEKKFPPLNDDRRAALERKFAPLARELDRSTLFTRLEEAGFDRDDMPFLAGKLLSSASLPERFVAAVTMKLLVAQPLRMDVPIDARPEAVADVAENWRVHYESNSAEYHPSALTRTARVLADTQYAHMVVRLATFNFGRSALTTREPVSERIWAAVKVSAPLMLLSQALIYLIAVPLGVVCAVRRGRTADYVISLVLFMLYSMPSFIVGMLCLMALCYGKPFKWFPMLGLHSEGAAGMTWSTWLLDYGWHSILPVICLALFNLAGLAMYSRSSMLDVLGQDYIRTARAKGVREFHVIFKHALRNGLIPIITLFSSFLPAMLGGSVLVEYLFGIPGMGRLSFYSIEQKDFPTLMALIYIDAIVVMLSILLSDLLYVVVDPRISFSATGEG